MNDKMQNYIVPYNELIERAVAFKEGKIILEDIKQDCVAKLKTDTEIVSDKASGIVGATTNANFKANNKSKIDIIINIAAFATMCLIAIMSLFFYATPVTEIGGIAYKESSLGILSFLYFADDSVINQLFSIIESLENISINSENITSILAIAMKFIRVITLIIPTFVFVITLVINFIYAIVHLINKSTYKLVKTIINTVCMSLIVYVFFSFFGSVSGGSGIDEYYMGYYVGTGFSVSILISLCLIYGLSAFMYIRHRNDITISQEVKKDWIRMAIISVTSAAIGIAVSFMRIYSVFTYFYTSMLTLVSGISTNGINFSSILFALLNFILFYTACAIYKRIITTYKISTLTLMQFGRSDCDDKQFNAFKQKKLLNTFKIMIIYSAISVIAIILLNVPALGYGWSVDIYAEYAAILILSMLAQVGLNIFKNSNKTATPLKA